MEIRIIRPRVLLQQAGTELPLEAGEVYDLPDPVATSLVATGAAELVGDEETGMPEKPRGPLSSPEQKPAAPGETKTTGKRG